MSTRKYRVCKNDRRYLEYEYNGQWILFPSDSAPIDFGFVTGRGGWPAMFRGRGRLCLSLCNFWIYLFG